MPLSISFANDKLPEKGSLILTADGGKLGAAGKQLDKAIGGAISRAIKIKKFKGKPGSMFALLAPAKSTLDRIVVIGIGDSKKLTAADAEKMGGTALGTVEKADGPVTLLLEPFGAKETDGELAARAAAGALLRDYKFEQYKTKKKTEGGPSKFTVATKAATAARKAYAELKAIAEGTMVARDLVNEPSNILTPPEFAKRTKALSKLGVKVEVLGEAQMKKLGMGSLLGVGQGSVPTARWSSCSGTGGQIAKAGGLHRQGRVLRHRRHFHLPAGGMEDMKGDMGGSGRRDRPDACTGQPQGQGQCGRRHRPRREHARRQCAAARRHRHLHVRADH